MNELSTESLKLRIKEGEFLDTDLKKTFDRFNDFLEVKVALEIIFLSSFRIQSIFVKLLSLGLSENPK